MTDAEADEIIKRMAALIQQIREARLEMKRANDRMREAHERSETRPEKAGHEGMTVEITIRVTIKENFHG